MTPLVEHIVAQSTVKIVYCLPVANSTPNRTKLQFAGFQSGGFYTVIVVNPPESKLTKRTSVHPGIIRFSVDAPSFPLRVDVNYG